MGKDDDSILNSNNGTIFTDLLNFQIVPHLVLVFRVCIKKKEALII